MRTCVQKRNAKVMQLIISHSHPSFLSIFLKQADCWSQRGGGRIIIATEKSPLVKPRLSQLRF